MELNLIDLSGFTLLEQIPIETEDNRDITRTEYEHGLVIVTELDSQTKQVKLHANYGWQKNAAGKWTPNLEEANAYFKDPLDR